MRSTLIMHCTQSFTFGTNKTICITRHSSHAENLQTWPQPTHSVNLIFPTHFCNSIPANHWAEQNKPRIKNVLKGACNSKHSSVRRLKLLLTFDLLH